MGGNQTLDLELTRLALYIPSIFSINYVVQLGICSKITISKLCLKEK
jgi:hypothetical protein